MSAEDIFLWWLLHATFGRLSGTLACCKPCLWVPPPPIITSLYYKGRELWPETLLGLGLSHHLEPWAPGNPPGPESDKIGSSKTWIPWPGGSRRPAGIPGSPSNMAVLKVYQAVIWGQGCHFIIIIFSLHNKRKLSKKKMHSFINTKHFVTKDHILCDPIYMKCPEQAKLWRKEVY